LSRHFASLNGETQRHPKEFLEDKSNVRRATHAFIIIERRFIVREMDVAKRGRPRDELVTGAQFFRQGLFDRFIRKARQDFIAARKSCTAPASTRLRSSTAVRPSARMWRARSRNAFPTASCGRNPGLSTMRHLYYGIG